MTAFIYSSSGLLGLAMVQVSRLDRNSPTLTVGLRRLSKKLNANFRRVFVRSHETIFQAWRGMDKDRNPARVRRDERCK
jgi:hypothetical protein